jgi:hypothetical protein
MATRKKIIEPAAVKEVVGGVSFRSNLEISTVRQPSNPHRR